MGAIEYIHLLYLTEDASVREVDVPVLVELDGTHQGLLLIRVPVGLTGLEDLRRASEA